MARRRRPRVCVRVPAVRLAGLRPAAVRRRQSPHGARLQRLAGADAGRFLQSARRSLVGSDEVQPASGRHGRRAAGLQGAACSRRSSATPTVRNPNERGPWFLNENIAVARTFAVQKTRVELRFEVFNLLNRTIWAAPGLDHHQRQLRKGHDAGQFAAPDAARGAVRVLISAACTRFPRGMNSRAGPAKS